MSGVKETKEALVAALKIAPILVKQFQDGAQLSDVSELYAKIWADEGMKVAVMAAYEGYDQIPEEVKDLDAAEVVELLSSALPEVLALVKALKA